MPRKPRIKCAGACYQVLSRGYRREPVFLDDIDLWRSPETLTESCERTGWMFHSYVLIGNQYHWLLEILGPNLVVGMEWFQ